MAAIIFLALGALMLYFAVEIGMRRRIAFLHDYHYQNMKEEDITPYLHLMGVGLAVVGICFVSSAVTVSYTHLDVYKRQLQYYMAYNIVEER